MLTLYEFNEAERERFTGSFEDIKPQLNPTDDREMVQWLDIPIKDTDYLEQISEHFKLHHLTVEDINATRGLPKLEAFENYIFMTIKMLNVDEQGDITLEHLSFVVGKNFVLTFQQLPGDVFEDVRDRIMNNKGYVRKRKADYLFTRLIDAIVDHYGITLEFIRSHIESLEVDLLDDGMNRNLIKEILAVKKELNLIRSYMVPLREVLTRIRTETGTLLHKTSYTYLTDIQDHLYYHINSFEIFREMLRDLVDLHSTQIDNDMNKVMKTLTVISALFIPLTFLTGLYGMNFEHMPETKFEWAYPILLGVMLLIVLGLTWYMKKRKWF